MSRGNRLPVNPVVAGGENYRPPVRRSRTWLWFVIGLGIPLLLLLFGLGYLVLDEMSLAPFAIRDIPTAKEPGQGYSLSAEQAALVGQLGYPESFAILFYEEQQADNTTAQVRAETWTYYSQDKVITFVDGVKTDEQKVGASVTGVIPIPYKPEQFTKFMSLQDLVASAGLTEVMDIPLERELVEGGEVYYGDQITFGMKDGELLYVETLALVEAE